MRTITSIVMSCLPGVLMTRLLGGVLVALPAASQQVRLHGGPETLRLEAIKAPLPVFPVNTGNKIEGLVVVEIEVSPDGSVRTVTLVETFSDPAWLATKSAVERWRFRPLHNDGSAADNAIRNARMLFRYRLTPMPHVADLAAETILGASTRAHLRLQAIDSPLPEYPARTLSQKKQGAVSVLVTVNRLGYVERLTKRYSFDEDAWSALAAALKRWRFKAGGDPRTGQLLFSFTITGGLPAVSDVTRDVIDAAR